MTTTNIQQTIRVNTTYQIRVVVRDGAGETLEVGGDSVLIRLSNQ